MAFLFSIRSAHLPGNNWCQDWIQWMQNNHPLLGLCCRHKLNPVGSLPRGILLLSSVCYGIIATNVVYLFYREKPSADGNIAGSTITYERVALFTIGGLLHSLADLGMWHLTACACCRETREGKKRMGWISKVGPYFAVLISVMMVASATFYVMKRVTYEQQERGVEGIDSASFLVDFGMELVTVYLCWHPVMSTFFFSGIIWPIFPCIGGRPKELKRQQEEAKRIQLKSSNAEGKTANIV